MTVLAAAPPPPPHFAYCNGAGCTADAKVQATTWAWAPTCITGRSQSPIDIVTANVATATVLDGGILTSFAASRLVPSNMGHNFQLTNTVEGPHAMLRGEKSVFAQAHWHAPSENTIDGKQAAMEAHFVFQYDDPMWKNTTQNLAVVGVLFDEAAECNPELSVFWSLFPTDKVGAASDTVTGASLQALLTKLLRGGYYHWTGSLTTPPCTELVDWNLLKARAPVCAAQIARLKEGLSAVQSGVSVNNRVVQPLHQRVVAQTSV